MTTKTIKAWHWVGSTLRDGQDIPQDGVKLPYSGEIKLCNSGLHASIRLIDALKYAPNSTLCRVELSGDIIEGYDKLVASERVILWRIDAEKVLREFARKASLTVFDKITFKTTEDKELVFKWLTYGREEDRAAAESAAQSAAQSAARSAALSAALSAARYAARSAAQYAARSAAQSAAEESLNKILLNLVYNERTKA